MQEQRRILGVIRPQAFVKAWESLGVYSELQSGFANPHWPFQYDTLVFLGTLCILGTGHTSVRCICMLVSDILLLKGYFVKFK